ncbi:hypothetical protein [Usitatibacter palustris]|uniref:hypothetical protein n=1 Tax=Usitatibacter palustris TaxID=2732487 RepID=UPI001487CEF7|nr:hypothetical protein [Usitatibacter palustris]
MTVASTGPTAVGNAVVRFGAPTGAAGGVTVSPSGTTDVNVPIQAAGCAIGDCGILGFALATEPKVVGEAAFNVVFGRVASAPTSAPATLNYSCTSPQNYAPQILPAASGTLTLQPNQITVLTITPTQLPPTLTSASITCNLTNIVGAQPAQTSYTLNVTGPAGPVIGNCPATNATIHDITAGGNRAFMPMSGNDSGAVKFSPVRGSQASGIGMVTMPVPGYFAPQGNFVQIAIAECPGNFTPVTPACGYAYGSNSLPIDWSTSGSPAWKCQLDPAKQYYYNVRFHNPATSTSTCSGSCAVYVDFSYN